MVEQQNRGNQDINRGNVGQTGGTQGNQMGGGQGGAAQTGGQNVQRIRDKLRGVDFPVTKDQILQQKGNERLEFDQGRGMTLREALQGVRQDRFQNEQELINNISQANNLERS